MFTGCARAPLAGLLLALPALAATGLLETAHTVYGALPNGFYSLDTMLCESVFRALLGQARAEGAARIDPPALGRVLGLDRAPEVKTIRRKIRLLAEAAGPATGSPRWPPRTPRTRPEQTAVLYVDGHVRAYQGTRRIAKTHVPRLKFPAPATVETWVADAAGDPLLVVMAEPAASLVLRAAPVDPAACATAVGDDRRVLVGFDRGGWSATLFADLDAAGFDTLTWRKGAAADIEEALFTECVQIDELGRTHTWRLADTEVALDIADGPRTGEVFAMRQISLFNAAATRQMHILTTHRDLTGQLRSATGWGHAGARRTTTATRVSISTSTPTTPTAPPMTTRTRHGAEPGQEARLRTGRKGPAGTASGRNRSATRNCWPRILAATRAPRWC